jgi:hypothetical protein
MMTIATLTEIRRFLSKVVVHGDEQKRLLHLIDSIDAEVTKNKGTSQAA